MRYEIRTTANPAFTGRAAGIAFADGKATLDGEGSSGRRALAYFTKKAGYSVTAVNEAPAEPKRPAKSASKTDWLAYLIAQGVPAEKVDSLNRDQLADQADALIAEAQAATENGGAE